ncbi:Type I phosphodiesterase / nucleotide pyrophosphatase [Dyadobacter koreensis]|uniref:Type I phosphodiesterase / nucleotide pyrophosphatase n=1 Tax=Dyadobacter koreensis TaxID=408657 RepID=A0A1H6QNN3_9BACT|nr:alkaline phosphatase family protein [Dyadobacter koreensis]SEI40885.1 Type I phosphodiesterase / nucleotide pyrophosphatase [Dyadobacter koreensis]
MALNRTVFSLILLFAFGSVATAQNSKNKVLFVIVDGISYEQLKKVQTPNLDAIAKAGGMSRAYVGGEKKTYSQTPTISAVGYNSLLTGTWVNKHNVWDNNIKKPNYHYWTIFRFFRETYPAKRTAIFSTWLDNRTKLIGTDLPQTGNMKMDYFFDGFELDTINFPHDKNAEYISKIDGTVVDEAAEYIRNEGPDLSWVYLEFTDDMGHRYGNSDPFYSAIRRMDAQMGQLWKSVKERETKHGENWQIFITTDHGRGEPAGKNHGGQSDAERSTWIVTNARDLNEYFTKSAARKQIPSIVDILPTMARHLELKIPKEQFFELDGIPLTGKISLAEMTAKKGDGKIDLSWTAQNSDGNVKIWLAVTNQFETGGNDRYMLMSQARVTDGKAVIDISKLPKGFYKIVLEGKYNTLNRWIVD